MSINFSIFNNLLVRATKECSKEKTDWSNAKCCDYIAVYVSMEENKR